MSVLAPAGESPERILAEIRTASEAFGAAREGTHIAAYAQARVIRNVTWLLAEGRWALAGLADAGALIDAIRLESYRLSKSEREAIEQAVKAADASVSNRRIARMLGVDHQTVNNDMAGENSPPAPRNANENNGQKAAAGENSPPGLSGEQAARIVGRKEDAADARRERKTDRAEASVLPPGLHRGECRDVLAWEAASVDWVITDPPYSREFLPVYDDLAEAAAHVLKPGGSLLCMCGQSYLLDVGAMLAKRLTYQWQLAYLTQAGGQAVRLWDRKVHTFWKPVFWFVKGRYEGEWIGDVATSGDNDKRFHEWGQSESGMADLMQRFVKPGDAVLDPFMGGGTTGVIALALGARFMGIERDAVAFAEAAERIAGQA